MGWLPIFKKEMRLYFGSPVAYAVATFFLFIAAFFFAPSFIQYAEFSMRSAMQPQMGQTLNATENILRPLTYNMAVVLLFFIPMLTMRLFAEEKRSGTMRSNSASTESTRLAFRTSFRSNRPTTPSWHRSLPGI